MILGPKVEPKKPEPAPEWREVPGKPGYFVGRDGRLRYDPAQSPTPPAKKPAGPGAPYQVPLVQPCPPHAPAWPNWHGHLMRSASDAEASFFAPGVHRVILPFWL